MCILLVAEPSWSQPVRTITREQVSIYPVESNLEVKLRDGKTLRGKLVSVRENAFELRPHKSRLGGRRPDIVVISYGDVKTVKRHRLSPGEVGVIVSIAAAAGVIVAVSVVLSQNQGR
jgi:hypothetical protein